MEWDEALRRISANDGGAFTPEAKIVVTERGKFVVAHGQEQM